MIDADSGMNPLHLGQIIQTPDTEIRIQIPYHALAGVFCLLNAI